MTDSTTATAPPLSSAEIAGMTDHSALSAAMREGRVPVMVKDRALDRLEQLLRAQPDGAPVQARPDAPTLRGQLPDSSAFPSTQDEAQKMNALEREAYTAPAKLASDYRIPGDGVIRTERQEVNDSIRSALFAAGMPVAVAHSVLRAADAIAQQLDGSADADHVSLINGRHDIVQAELQRRWGADYESRLTQVKTYLRTLADKAAAAGQPALKGILTETPELLDDPNGIEALWNAARHAKR